MTNSRITFASVKEAVIAAIDETTGFQNDRAAFQAITAGQDLPLSMLELDSLATFEIIMTLEESFGLELDTDAFNQAGTIDGLTRLLTQRLNGHDT